MTRIKTEEIPNRYVRLDGEVSSSDTFANVRNLQRVRLNHNKLLATRMRRVLLNLSASGGTSSWAHSFKVQGSPAYKTDKILVQAPVFLSHRYLVEARLKIVVTGANGSPVIYPRIHHFSESPVWSVGISETLTASTTEDIEVPISRKAREAGEGIFVLGASAAMVGTGGRHNGPAEITEAGRDYFECLPNTFAIGNWVYVTTNLTIQPRTVVHIEGDRYFIDRPWNIVPTAETDTVDARDAAYGTFSTLTLYEERIASFSEDGTNAWNV